MLRSPCCKMVAFGRAAGSVGHRQDFSAGSHTLGNYPLGVFSRIRADDPPRHYPALFALARGKIRRYSHKVRIHKPSIPRAHSCKPSKDGTFRGRNLRPPVRVYFTRQLNPMILLW